MSNEEEKSFHEDAINRNQRILDHQIEGIRNVQGRAAEVARLGGLFLGLLLTVLSLLYRFGGVSLSFPNIISLIVAIVALLTSILAAVLTYFAEPVFYGANIPLRRLDRGEKSEIITEILEVQDRIHIENYHISRRKELQLRISLTLLLIGLLYVTTSIAFLLHIFSIQTEIIILIIVTLVSATGAVYLHRGEHLYAKGW